MKNFTIKLDKNQIEMLLDNLKTNLIRDNNEYVLFHARLNGVELITYTTGNLLIRGNEIIDTINYVKKILNITDYEAIGNDEVGTGDLFGPVVVCSCLVKMEDFTFLEELGVKDSKKLSDKKIMEIGPKIADRLTHSLYILSPRDYNKLISEGSNLNQIKAILHNKAFISTISKYAKPVPKILDMFCSKENYFKYLKGEKYIHRDILFHEKAEQIHISVASAAVIARYAFLVQLSLFQKKININLPKGASKDTTLALKNIIDKFGKKATYSIAKSNFKNVLEAFELSKED